MAETKKKDTKAAEKKAAPTKKAEPAKKPVAEKKAEPAKKAATPAKKETAAKTAAPAKKETAAKTAAPAKKAEPAKKTAVPAKATEKKAAAPKAKAADEITEAAVTGKGMFEVKRAADGRYMFNVRAGNTQVIASSQMYTAMASCRNGIKSVGVNAPIAAIEDQTLSTVNKEKCPKFQIYFDKAGKYRFNLLAANGDNILSCTQGYTQKSSCKNGINSVINNANAVIVLPGDDD